MKKNLALCLLVLGALGTAHALQPLEQAGLSAGLATGFSPARTPSARQAGLAESAAREGVQVRWEPRWGTPSVVRGLDLARSGPYSRTGAPAVGASAPYADRALAVMDNLAGLFELRDARQELAVIRTTADRLGFHHVRLAQRYHGLRVIGGDLIVHFDESGTAREVNGQFVPGVDLEVKALIGTDQAVQLASQDLVRLGQSGLRVMKRPELVVWALATRPTLAYELMVTSQAAPEGPGRWRFWIDARSGVILLRINDLKTIAPPSASGVHSNVTGVLLAGEGGSVVTNEGWREDTGDFYLYNKNNTWYIFNVAASGYPDNSTYAYRTSSDWGSTDRTEVSAGRAFQAIESYYRTVLGRASFDDADGYARANVHFGNQYVNAFWNGVDFTFGDGDNVEASSLAVLDVAAHEFQHGVTENTGNLFYYSESGALNESYSDIFGASVEFFGQEDGRASYPGKSAGKADWLLGEDCWLSSTALRDMRSPANAFTVGAGNEQPSRYHGTFWYYGAGDNQGVHYNSGPANFMFYLLCEGGSGNNDGILYNVAALGLTNAEQVAYRAMAAYVTEFTDFAGMRECWISAARDFDPTWVRNVVQAWAAIGIGSASPSVLLDRLAYRSDATVQFEVEDFSIADPNVTVAAVVTDPSDVIRWSSDETGTLNPATLRYEGAFGLTGNALEGDLLTMTYTNVGGELAVATAPIDDTPPVLGDFSVIRAGDDYATVRWLSDEPSDSRIILATDIPPGGLGVLPLSAEDTYTTETVDIGGVTKYVHTLTVTGLIAATRYSAAVLSADYAGNESTLPADLTSTDPADYLAVITSVRYVVYENRMNSGTAGWIVTNLHGETCWEFGVPSYGPGRAYSGRDCWGTILNGRYPNLANAWVQSVPIYVRSSPRLTFWSWHELDINDMGFVEVDDGTGWRNVTPSFLGVGVNALTGSSGDWQLISVNLDFVTSASIRVRFRLETDASGQAAGWYIDDFTVSDVPFAGLNIASYRVNDAVGGDGDGHVEPGETFKLELDVVNSYQTETLLDARATVQSPSAGVTLQRGPSVPVLYGDLAPGMHAESGTQIVATVSSGVADGTIISFLHQATATNGGAWSDSIRLEVGRRVSILGVVTNLAGSAITGAVVVGEAEGYDDIEAVTTNNGQYSLNGALPGVAYEVTASKPGDYSRSAARLVTGPATGIRFGLGRAYANADPTVVMASADEGATVEEVVTLANTNANADMALLYDAEIEYLLGDGWLSVEPESGALPVGSATNLALTMNFAGLPEGIYVAVLHLACNDVFEPDIEILVGAMVSAAPSLSLYEVSLVGAGHDGDPFVEPGETFDLQTTLLNRGALAAEALAGGLEYVGSDPVTVAPADAAWPDIAPLALGVSTLNPTVNVGGGIPDGTELPFVLTATDVVGRVFSMPFSLTTTVRYAISGLITECPGGTPVQDARVLVLGAAGIEEALSDATGAYSLYGLTSGTVTVRVIPPLPFASPAVSNVVVAGADVAGVDFCVDGWAMTVSPTSMTVTVQEGREAETNLVVSNGGLVDGSAGFAVQLVQGAAVGDVLPLVMPTVKWSSLKTGDYVPGELLVRYRDDASVARRTAALSRLGVRRIRDLNRGAASLLAAPSGVSLQTTAERLMQDPAVLYVEPNYLRKLYRVPNDPMFGALYGLRNERQTGGTLGADIRAAEAWDVTVGDTGVVVAINDTGVLTTHPDLAANLLPGYDFGDDDPDPNPFLEAHGTHVAGTVGAVGHNSVGVAGVNWNVRLMPLKIARTATDPDTGLPTDVLPTDAIIAALDYAVTNGVKVSNHSYGGPLFSGLEYEMFYKAYSNGHIAVCAAGNEMTDNDLYPSYPNDYAIPSIIAVAACDHNDQLAWFSNYGKTSVDIAAPGMDILSTWANLTNDPPEAAYETISGTSMAAPHVAGVCALLRAIAPWASWDMIKDAVLDGARYDKGLEGKVVTGGHLDAAGALARLRPLWVRLAAEAGDVPAGGAFTNRVILNAGGTLVAGTYRAHILVNQGLNVVTVPVTLTVTPAPVPVVAEVTVSGGDQDGYAEPGETVNLSVRLVNTGSAILAAPTGTLSSSAAGVTIGDAQSAWPSAASGMTVDPKDTMTVSFAAGVTNLVPFSLLITNRTQGSWARTFDLPVQTVHAISGYVRDNQSAAALTNAAVEYWGALSGRVWTDGAGFYRITGLTNGMYKLRAVPSANEKSAVVTNVIADANQVRNFSLRRPAVGLATNVVLAAPLGAVVTNTLTITNTAADSFVYDAIELPARTVALIADGTQLTAVASVLVDMGLRVDNYVSNYVEWASDPLDGSIGPGGLYSGDDALVFRHDLVIVELRGPTGAGRLLSPAEEDVFARYLERGGKLIFTGANPISRPDDRRAAGLLGIDSLDRSAEDATVAEVVTNLPSSWFVPVSVTDRLAVASQEYDQATPVSGTGVVAYIRCGSAVKLLRRTTADGGVAYYWGGNEDGMDWTQRGVWQDIFKSLVLWELQVDVPWLQVSPVSATVTAGTQIETLRGDAAGLSPEGMYEAAVLFKGNYPGAENRFAAVKLAIVVPSLQAISSTGVMDWMNRWLVGNGAAGSSLFQLIYAGPNGVIDPPRADGKPSGDDVLLAVKDGGLDYGRFGVGFEFTPDIGKFSETFLHGVQGAAASRAVYVRAWDGSTFAGSVAYGESSLYSLNLSANESHDFGTWLVNRALGYPGLPGAVKDSNGDSIPDGWDILNGLDPRRPIEPLPASWSNRAFLGTAGSGANQMLFPTRLFLTDRFVFDLDRGNERVQVWDRSTRALVLNYGGGGGTPGLFAEPYGMGKDPAADRFAVADTENDRVQVFTFDPGTGAIAFEQQFGSYGSADGQMKRPHDVAIGSLGWFYVADTENHRVQVFDETGAFLFAFGTYGTVSGQFKSPYGIALDDDGIVYVADMDNNRVQVFNGSGVHLWNIVAAGTQALNRPCGVHIGPDGRLYVADTSNHRIQVFNRTTQAYLGGLGSQGVEKGQLKFPYDAEPCATSAVIYVADTWNHRIQELEMVVDGDGDGMDDAWERLNGLDPDDPSDALLDSDGDGVLNIGEARLRTNPHAADTDGDGFGDGEEIAGGSDPNDPSDIPDEVFVIVEAGRTPGFAVRWPGVAGAVYHVETNADLMGGGNWGMLPGSIFTSTVTGTIGLTNAPADAPARLFYRAVRRP